MMNIENKQLNPDQHFAGLFRRLFAIFYDTFLLTAILFIVTAIANALNHGNAIGPGDTYYPLYVFVVVTLCYLYFSWFWIHGGQTLGMKTWRIRMISSEGNRIGWKQTTTRLIFAIISWGFFGLGFLWSLLDKENRCWHDMVSKTVLLDLRMKKKG